MPNQVISNIKIPTEIPLFFLFFALTFSAPLETNLIIFRTCYVTLGYNQSECALLGTKHPDNLTTQLEKIVQPHAATINTSQMVLKACLSAVICLFVGPWSDRFGRKPMLVIPMIGFTACYMFATVYASVQSLSPWYSLIYSIPMIFTGGVSTYLSVFFCYITDITTKDNRGLRMGYFEAAMSLGVLLGTLSSAYVFDATGYVIVFLISGLCCLLNVILTVFFIPESLPNTESESRIKELFKLNNIREMAKITFKKRQNYHRLTLMFCMLIVIIFVIHVKGEAAVTFLFLREKFHWSLETYTVYSTVQKTIWILGTIVGVYFLHKLLKIPETIMIFTGCVSLLNGTLVMGLAKTDRDVYSAAVFQSPGAVLSPMLRSMISKIIPNEEIGTIFSFLIASETILGMAGSPIYTAIYEATIMENSSMFNFVSAGMYFVATIIAITLIIIRTVRRADTHNSQINDDSEEQLIHEDALTA